MGYVDPKSVLAPKTVVSNLEVVFDTGPQEASWSVATFEWNGRPAVGIRWNGEPSGRGIGTPQARGVPTWFVVPEELEEAVVAGARALSNGSDPRLIAGYQQMAKDKKREGEAQEWSEGLIADAER